MNIIDCVQAGVANFLYCVSVRLGLKIELRFASEDVKHVACE